MRFHDQLNRKAPEKKKHQVHEPRCLEELLFHKMSWFGSVRKKILCKWNLHLPTKSWLPVYWLLHQRTLAISLSQCLAVVQKILFSGPGAVEDLGIFPLNLPSPLATLQPLQQTLEAPNWIKIWISSGSTIIPKYKEWTPKIIPKLNLGGQLLAQYVLWDYLKKY